MAWSEGHFTFLNLTLKPLCLISRTSWCYFRKLWAVSRSNRSAILIHTLHCNWIWTTYKLLVWNEGHSSIWGNRVGSLSWNHFFLASIVEGWLDCFIDWNQWVTTLEAWCAYLRKTLRTCAGCVSSCRSDFFHYCLVLDSNRSSVVIHTSQFKLWCFTLELLIWGEGHFAVCVHFELTNIWHFLHSCSIVK